MTNFEQELRMMLTDSEVALLERYLGSSKWRDGAIASLVARKLREYNDNGMIDILNGNG